MWIYRWHLPSSNISLETQRKMNRLKRNVSLKKETCTFFTISDTKIWLTQILFKSSHWQRCVLMWTVIAAPYSKIRKQDFLLEREKCQCWSLPRFFRKTLAALLSVKPTRKCTNYTSSSEQRWHRDRKQSTATDDSGASNNSNISQTSSSWERFIKNDPNMHINYNKGKSLSQKICSVLLCIEKKCVNWFFLRNTDYPLASLVDLLLWALILKPANRKLMGGPAPTASSSFLTGNLVQALEVIQHCI